MKAYCHTPDNEVIRNDNKTETNREDPFFHSTMAIDKQNNGTIVTLRPSPHKVANNGDYSNFHKIMCLIDTGKGDNDCDMSNTEVVI